MLDIRYNNIKITRGDYAEIQLKVYTFDNARYYSKAGDIVKFIVTKAPECDTSETPIIEKEFNGDKVKLESIDTKFLKAGTYYWRSEYTFGGLTQVDSNFNLAGKTMTICNGLFKVTDECS